MRAVGLPFACFATMLVAGCNVIALSNDRPAALPACAGHPKVEP